MKSLRVAEVDERKKRRHHVRARKGLDSASRHAVRTRGTLQHSALTTAAIGEAQRHRELIQMPVLSFLGAGDVDALRGRPVERCRTRIELSLDGFLAAR